VLKVLSKARCAGKKEDMYVKIAYRGQIFIVVALPM